MVVVAPIASVLLRARKYGRCSEHEEGGDREPCHKMQRQGEGYQTMAAAHGQSAIALAGNKDAEPDKVIVVHNFPSGVSGVQIVDQIREIVSRDFPALILTGDLSLNTLREIARRGCVYRGKPIRAKDLAPIFRALRASCS